MKDATTFIQSADFYLQASNLILATAPLQNQIQVCNDELMTLITLGRYRLEMDRVQALKDEIFGCKIEIQALRVKARRLSDEARRLRSARAL